jgi:hypothetical protein
MISAVVPTNTKGVTPDAPQDLSSVGMTNQRALAGERGSCLDAKKTVGFNQWWVPLVEFTAGGADRALGATRRAWPSCPHRRSRRHVRPAATQTLQAHR